MDKKDLKALIGQYASEPLPPWEEHYLDYHAARYLDTLAILGPGQGQRLLDVGAFPGHITVAAHHLGFQVDGLTGRAESTPSLQMIVDRLGRHNIPVALADVESEPFPFADESFDVVLALEIIEHLHFNPFRLFREAFRVLKPKGRILLSTPNLARLENHLRLLGGRSIHSDLKGRFYEVFSSILSARHVREYTAHELTYMLEWQNKEMYRFEKARIFYSACLDPSYSWPRLARLISRFWPRFRSTLLVEALRPSQMKLIHPEELEPVQGFYAVEKQMPDMEGIAQMLTTLFRWTGGRAEISLPASEAPYQVFYLNLVYLVPWSLPPGYWDITVGGKPVSQICLAPDRMFTQLRLVLSHDLARQGRFPLCISGKTWRPRDHQGTDDYEFSINDDRDLGLVVGWDGFLRVDCDSYEALLALARRESSLMEQYENNQAINWRKYDDRWSHFKTLYLLQADFKPVLPMGKKDWRQLGQGWYFLENWNEGPIRWTSRYAEAYLSAKLGSRHLRLRVFSGESRLGTRITGTLKIAFSQDRFSFIPIAEDPFELPAGIWTDLGVKFPQKIPAPGIIRLVLQTDQSRSPARLIAGSTDTRELGLAVAGMAVR